MMEYKEEQDDLNTMKFVDYKYGILELRVDTRNFDNTGFYQDGEGRGEGRETAEQ